MANSRANLLAFSGCANPLEPHRKAFDPTDIVPDSALASQTLRH
jgi:hypothetical protein